MSREVTLEGTEQAGTTAEEAPTPEEVRTTTAQPRTTTAEKAETAGEGVKIQEVSRKATQGLP